MAPEADVQSVQPAQQRVYALVENEHGGALAFLRRFCAEQRSDCRFPRSGGAGDERAGSPLESTAHQPIESDQAAGDAIPV